MAGGALNLQDAIADAQKIAAGRPLYDKAQRLIGRWQVAIQELARLEQAKKLAAAGDLQNAIDTETFLFTFLSVASKIFLDIKVLI
ncbi:MAG: hypothetical protein HC805_08335 [Alkalinema sp. RL_2_19]|nr:hypothetical protein [Alkalinema sp. RL_2_19]